jgi:Glycosyltransferase family 87
MLHRIPRTPLLVVTVFLSLLGTIYVGRGLQQLVATSSSTEAKDLRTNWEELRLVLAQENPYESATPSPYPPFTYPANFVFLWPPWPAVRLYFALLNLICLGFLMGWAYRVTALRDAAFAAALMVSIPAASAVSTGVGLGQNAVVYTALLIVALVLYRRRLWIESGLVLGVAMSKISISLPFVLPFVFRKDWKVLVGAALYIVGGTLLVCLWLRASPLHLIQLWVHGAERFACVGYGPATLMCELGVPVNIANRATEGVVVLVAATTFAWLRRLPLITLFGLAAGFGRLWAYHRIYDDFLVVILLVALADTYLRTNQWQVGTALVAVGITLWLPPKMTDFQVIQIMHLVIWGAAMIILAIWASRATEARGDDSAPTTRATTNETK